MALEVLRFLVLDQNLLIIKFPIAVPVLKKNFINFGCRTWQACCWWTNLLIEVALSCGTHQHQGLDCFFFFLPIFLPSSWSAPYHSTVWSFISWGAPSTVLPRSQIWNGNGLCPDFDTVRYRFPETDRGFLDVLFSAAQKCKPKSFNGFKHDTLFISVLFGDL